jgi:hypothetical protein
MRLLVHALKQSWQELVDDLRPLGLTPRARAVFAAFGIVVGTLATLAVLADVGLALFDVVIGAEQDTEAAMQMVVGPFAIIVGTALFLGAVLVVVAAVDAFLRGIRRSVARFSA